MLVRVCQQALDHPQQHRGLVRMHAAGLAAGLENDLRRVAGRSPADAQLAQRRSQVVAFECGRGQIADDAAGVGEARAERLGDRVHLRLGCLRLPVPVAFGGLQQHPAAREFLDEGVVQVPGDAGAFGEPAGLSLLPGQLVAGLAELVHEPLLTAVERDRRPDHRGRWSPQIQAEALGRPDKTDDQQGGDQSDHHDRARRR